MYGKMDAVGLPFRGMNLPAAYQFPPTEHDQDGSIGFLSNQQNFDGKDHPGHTNPTMSYNQDPCMRRVWDAGNRNCSVVCDANTSHPYNMELSQEANPFSTDEKHKNAGFKPSPLLCRKPRNIAAWPESSPGRQSDGYIDITKYGYYDRCTQSYFCLWKDLRAGSKHRKYFYADKYVVIGNSVPAALAQPRRQRQCNRSVTEPNSSIKLEGTNPLVNSSEENLNSCAKRESCKLSKARVLPPAGLVPIPSLAELSNLDPVDYPLIVLQHLAARRDLLHYVCVNLASQPHILLSLPSSPSKFTPELPAFEKLESLPFKVVFEKSQSSANRTGGVRGSKTSKLEQVKKKQKGSMNTDSVKGPKKVFISESDNLADVLSTAPSPTASCHPDSPGSSSKDAHERMKRHSSGCCSDSGSEEKSYCQFRSSNDRLNDVLLCYDDSEEENSNNNSNNGEGAPSKNSNERLTSSWKKQRLFSYNSEANSNESNSGLNLLQSSNMNTSNMTDSKLNNNIDTPTNPAAVTTCGEDWCELVYKPAEGITRRLQGTWYIKLRLQGCTYTRMLSEGSHGTQGSRRQAFMWQQLPQTYKDLDGTTSYERLTEVLRRLSLPKTNPEKLNRDCSAILLGLSSIELDRLLKKLEMSNWDIESLTELPSSILGSSQRFPNDKLVLSEDGTLESSCGGKKLHRPAFTRAFSSKKIGDWALDKPSSELPGYDSANKKTPICEECKLAPTGCVISGCRKSIKKRKIEENDENNYRRPEDFPIKYLVLADDKPKQTSDAFSNHYNMSLNDSIDLDSLTCQEDMNALTENIIFPVAPSLLDFSLKYDRNDTKFSEEAQSPVSTTSTVHSEQACTRVNGDESASSSSLLTDEESPLPSDDEQSSELNGACICSNVLRSMHVAKEKTTSNAEAEDLLTCSYTDLCSLPWIQRVQVVTARWRERTQMQNQSQSDFSKTVASSILGLSVESFERLLRFSGRGVTTF